MTQVQGGAAGTFDQLFRVGPGDVVIAICFPRYSELALKTVQYAKDRGATIIGVTDSEMSPVYQMSSDALMRWMLVSLPRIISCNARCMLGYPS